MALTKKRLELESGNDWYTKTAIISRIDPHFLGQHTLNQLMYAARKEVFLCGKKECSFSE